MHIKFVTCFVYFYFYANLESFLEIRKRNIIFFVNL